VGDGEPPLLPPVRVGAPEDPLPADGPDVEAEPAPDLDAEPEAAPEGVGSAVKRLDDWKVMQLDEDGMGAVKGREVMGPSDSGGSV